MNRSSSLRAQRSNPVWIATSAFGLLAMTTSCSLAPEFEVPKMDVPASWRAEPMAAAVPGEEGRWRPVVPMEKADRGRWWKIFEDEELNALEEQALAANQTLYAAAMRVAQSRALAEANTPSFLPNIDVGGNAVRAQPSSASLAAFGGVPGTQLKPYTLYSAQGVASYEADLFGRVRDNYKSYLADAEAQAAAYRSVLLTLQADVAAHYFALRALDAERQLLRETVVIREEAARILQRRFELGEAGEQDRSRTQSELYTVRADLMALDRGRAKLEHALAVLVGRVPSQFMLAESPLADMPPQIPPGLPSALLTRRPDISIAIASMQAANARIGVARTAFFPRLILTASGGYESTDLGDLFTWASRSWALGQLGASALTLHIFDSFRRSARLDMAHAAYEEAVANYRQQVLVAFRDVEDNLVDQRLLAVQSLEIEKAAAAATRTTDLTRKRYDGGDADYFELVDAQRYSLATERAAVQTRGQRFAATIGLIRALGGGW